MSRAFKPKKEVRKPISENFSPKRLAINFDPPTLIIEYMAIDTGKLYHHKMRLDSIMRKLNVNRIDVLNYVKTKHYLYFLNGKVKDVQLLKFIDKILLRIGKINGVGISKPNILKEIKQEKLQDKSKQFQSNFSQDDDFDYLNDDDEYEQDYEDYEEQPVDKPKIGEQKPVNITKEQTKGIDKNTFLTHCKQYEQQEQQAQWDLSMDENADFV